jgi:hypothetical protein
VTETRATPVPQPPVFPAGRYGRRRETRPASRVRTAAIALVVAIVGGGIALQLFNAYGDGDYSASVTGFTDITDKQVVITFMVRMPENATALCVLRARDTTGAEAGREEITVNAGPDPSRTMVTHRLVTRNQPVTAEVPGCRPA